MKLLSDDNKFKPGDIYVPGKEPEKKGELTVLNFSNAGTFYQPKEGEVIVGDEIYSPEDLISVMKDYRQPKESPFTPHHYAVQKAMDDLKEYRDKVGKGSL